MTHNKYSKSRRRAGDAEVRPRDETYLSEDPLTDLEPQPEGGLAEWTPVAVPADGDAPLP
jgi:hypothetical protein